MSQCQYSELPPFKRGDTWELVFTWKQIDLSEASIKMQVRSKREKVLACSISTSTILGEIIAVPPINSIFDITISVTVPRPSYIESEVLVKFPANLTKLVVPGKYVTDMEVTLQNGEVISTETLNILVVEDVTFIPVVTGP